mgnify:FL=1
MRKKNIQKSFLLILALAMLLALTACGGGSPENPSEVKGETFDAGNISALAPKGWKAFPVSDLFDEYEGDNNPNSMQICKDGDDEWDLLSKPYVMITYYGPEASFYSSKDWYDNVEDIESFTLGNYTWEGYTCTSLDYPYTILETIDGDIAIQVDILEKSSDKLEIALEDVDVQAIIASITVTE